MTNKPQTMDGYGGDSLALVRSTCLYVATKLGDLLDDVVIVGGLVPSLLVDQDRLPWNLDEHAGTMDLDMGLSLALLGEERYRELGLRLKDAGFEPDRNRAGNPTSQRWRLRAPQSTTIDFLIPPSLDTDKGGDLRHIETDFAAVITRDFTLPSRTRQGWSSQGSPRWGSRQQGTSGSVALLHSLSSKQSPFGAEAQTRMPMILVTSGVVLGLMLLPVASKPCALTLTFARHWP